MRPRKLILVLDPNDATLGIVMLTLSVCGYRVVGAHTVKEANEIGSEVEIDAILVREELEHQCNVPVVVAGKRSTAEILEELKIRTIKKRGPKKRRPQELS